MQIAQTIGREGNLVDWLLWYICTVTDCTTVVLYRVDNQSSYGSMRRKHHHRMKILAARYLNANLNKICAVLQIVVTFVDSESYFD
jgi:hypothetical protein